MIGCASQPESMLKVVCREDRHRLNDQRSIAPLRVAGALQKQQPLTLHKFVSSLSTCSEGVVLTSYKTLTACRHVGGVGLPSAEQQQLLEHCTRKTLAMGAAGGPPACIWMAQPA